MRIKVSHTTGKPITKGGHVVIPELPGPIEPPETPEPPDPTPPPIDPDEWVGDDWPEVEATPATLKALIIATAPEHKIVLTSGTYPFFFLKDLDKAVPGLLITQAEGADVTFQGVQLDRCKGLTFRGLNCSITTAKYVFPFYVVERCHVQGCRIEGPDGPVQTDPTLPFFGVTQIGFNQVWQAFLWKWVTDCSIDGNEVSDCRIGVGYAIANGLTIVRNHFHRLAGDGIRGAGQNIIIRENTGINFYKWNGNHADFIQFAMVVGWLQPLDPALPLLRPENILIEDNDFRRGVGNAIVQGIFMRGSPTIPSWKDVIIRRNSAVGGNHHGIAIGFGENVEISDNYVQANTLLGRPEYPAETLANLPWVNITDSTGTLLVARNHSSKERIIQGRNTPELIEGVTMVDNVLNVPRAPDNDYADVEAWRAGLE